MKQLACIFLHVNPCSAKPPMPTTKTPQEYPNQCNHHLQLEHQIEIVGTLLEGPGKSTVSYQTLSLETTCNSVQDPVSPPIQ